MAVSRGAAFGDVNNDGAVDVLVNVNNGQAKLLLNDAPKRNWLAVRFDGPRLGQGTRVEVKASGLPVQTRWVRTDSSYLSASDMGVYFGLAGATRIDTVTVRAPNGETRTFGADATEINRVFRIPGGR
jgi:hypothetical protein